MTSRLIRISTDTVALDGQLRTPDRLRGIVLFAHGSGSSRHSPRNIHVATVLNRSGLATLLFDLLTEHEAADRRHVFDVPVLARRLRCAAEAVRALAPTSAVPMGYFGASTGAAAAPSRRRPTLASAPSFRAGAGPTLPGTRSRTWQRPRSSSWASSTTMCCG